MPFLVDSIGGCVRQSDGLHVVFLEEARFVPHMMSVGRSLGWSVGRLVGRTDELSLKQTRPMKGSEKI